MTINTKDNEIRRRIIEISIKNIPMHISVQNISKITPDSKPFNENPIVQINDRALICCLLPCFTNEVRFMFN